MFRLLGGCLVAFGLVADVAAANADDPVFKLRETSAFGRGADFATGQRGVCQEEPFPEVKGYPQFTSSKPVYGSVSFAQRLGQPDSAIRVFFAADESQGTGKGYDRLYFDLNRDLDLRNDPVGKPLRNVPNGAELRWSNIRQQVCFEYLTNAFDCGSAGVRPVTIMPRLLSCEYDTNKYNLMFFVRTRMYEGTITVGSQELVASLGSTYMISGRLDDPATTLELVPKGGGETIRWWGGDTLMAVHKVDGKLFTFSATPIGDQLTVHPYRGELGKFEIGPGGRKLDTLGVRGSLRSTNVAVAVGGELGDGWPKPVRSSQLPVGDYLATYLTIDFGRLQIQVSDNYHSEGKARDRGGRPPVYGMCVRKDKPFVMDFSNPPAVMFTSPTNAQRVRLGGELEVKAVLTDPKLDLMIRGLEDTTRKRTRTEDGRTVNDGRNLSLDPMVVITRANGEKVNEGVMPFG